MTEKNLNWQRMRLLLSNADKKVNTIHPSIHPSNTIGLIRWQKQWQSNSNPALGLKKKRRKKKVMPKPTWQHKSKTVLLSVIRSGPGKIGKLLQLSVYVPVCLCVSASLPGGQNSWFLSELPNKEQKNKKKKKINASLTSLYIHARTHTRFLCIVWTATSRKKLGLLIALWYSFISGLACLSLVGHVKVSAVVRSDRM